MKWTAFVLCLSLALPSVAFAQGGPSQPSWEDILKQIVQTVLPTVVGALLHWLGVHLGGKQVGGAASDVESGGA